MIKENLIKVKEKINAACKRSQRNPEDVTLIAVSKTKPNEMIEEAIASGQTVFGENYVQELAQKIEDFPESIHWHMIGHLQRNKVKYIIGKVDCIHSVDSIRLAKQIQDEAQKRGISQDILLEINVGMEESKWGFTLETIQDALKEISLFPNIRVKGFMTSAPYVAVPEENRLLFRSLKQCFEETKQYGYPNVSMEQLSMGMTNDFEVAIEEGATMVRVGTAIFGERNYN